MNRIRIREGMNAVGNYTATSISCSESLRDDAIKNAKTLINQRWKSWDKTSPDMFLGFTTLESGRGYVVSSTGITDVILPNIPNPVFIGDIPVVVGDNFIAVPLNNEAVGDTERFKASIFKTIVNNKWRSFTKGTPDSFQGFTRFNKELGYFAKISEVLEVERPVVADRAAVVELNAEPIESKLSRALPYILAMDIAFENMAKRKPELNVSRGLRFSFYNSDI